MITLLNFSISYKKYIRKRVRMVAYLDLLGESSTLIPIALNMSYFIVRIIIAEFYKILHVAGRWWFQTIHSHHRKTRFRSLTDRLCCIVVKEKKFYLTYLIIIVLRKKKKIYSTSRLRWDASNFVFFFFFFSDINRKSICYFSHCYTLIFCRKN